jgi:hypothetical protein
VIEANRQNAQKSTGPRTEEGKSRARRNATKHGLGSKIRVFADDQERAEFEDLKSRLWADLNPKGVLEAEMVEEIATCVWKLRPVEEMSMQDIKERGQASKAILEVFANSPSGWDDPFAEQRVKLGNLASSSLKCQELFITIDAKKKEKERGKHNTGSLGERAERKDIVQFQAKLVGQARSFFATKPPSSATSIAQSTN